MTTPSRQRLFTSGLAANGVALGLSVLTVMLTALLLGAEGRGQIAVMTVIASYTVVAVGLSLESGILHFGRSVAVGARPAFRRLVTVVVLSTFLAGVVVLAVAAVVAIRPPLSGFVLAVFAVGYAAPVLVVPATALDRLEDRHHAATWRPVWVLVAQQLGGATGLLISPDVGVFLLAGGIASAAATTLTVFLHWRGRAPAGAGPVTGDSVPSARELVSYSVSGHGGVLMHLFAMRAPLIVVSAWLGASAAGQFSIATSLAELSLIVSQSQLGRVLAAATAAPSDFTVLRRELILGLLLSGVLACVIAFAARLAPGILGQEFDGVFWPTVVLLPGVVALGSWRLATNDLAARGYPAARSVSAVCGAAVVAALLALLVGPLGLLGAAAAASLGFAVMPLVLRFLPLHSRGLEEVA